MGKKLVIKRLESAKARQVKFSKRILGLLNKANELSVLCNVDLALIICSPSGKPFLFVAHNKELFSVVDRLSKISFEVREQRRSTYTMKLLEKIHANTNVDLKNFALNNSICCKRNYLKLQQNHLRELEEKVAEKKKILNEWKNPETIGDLNKVQIMEKHLMVSLENIKARKMELIMQALEQQEHDQASQGELDIQQQEEHWQQQIGHDSEALLEIEDLLALLQYL